MFNLQRFLYDYETVITTIPSSSKRETPETIV